MLHGATVGNVSQDVPVSKVTGYGLDDWDLMCVQITSGAGIATGYELHDWGFGVRVPVESRFFSSPRRPDRLWGSPSLLSNGCRRIARRA
jgi:hypothetical protein